VAETPGRGDGAAAVWGGGVEATGRFGIAAERAAMPPGLTPEAPTTRGPTGRGGGGGGTLAISESPMGPEPFILPRTPTKLLNTRTLMVAQSAAAHLERRRPIGGIRASTDEDSLEPPFVGLGLGKRKTGSGRTDGTGQAGVAAEAVSPIASAYFR
jgi:hypothetical protein